MPEAEEISIVRRALEVLDADGPDGLMARYEEFFAGQYEWRPALLSSVEGERTFVGKKQFALYWREFTAALGPPDLGEQSYEVLGGGRVLVTGHLRVKGVGSGVPIDREAAYIFKVEDGLIASASSFMSRREAEEFLAHA